MRGCRPFLCALALVAVNWSLVDGSLASQDEGVDGGLASQDEGVDGSLASQEQEKMSCCDPTAAGEVAGDTSASANDRRKQNPLCSNACVRGYRSGDRFCETSFKCCSLKDELKCDHAVEGVIWDEPEEEGEYEWEYYKVETVVDPDETNEIQVPVDDIQTSIQEVVETYVEYEYEYEYEYEGSLALGGEAIGKLSDKELPCPIHFIRDCGDFCAPAYWIGNGLCDDGGEHSGKIGAANFPFVKEGDITYMPDTNPNNLNKPKNDRASGDRVAYNFNCPQFWQDGGDCTSKEEAIQSEFDTRMTAALYLEVGGRQLGVPTLAIVVMAVVGIAGVAMRR